MNNHSWIDFVDYFFATRSTGDYVVFFTVVLVIVLIILWRQFNRYTQKRERERKLRKVLETLETAQLQNESFEIQVGEQEQRSSVPAILSGISEHELSFHVLNRVHLLWIGKPAVIYFFARIDRKRLGYRFRVPITRLERSDTSTLVYVKMPEDLDIGQKRSFFRIKPLPNTVKLVALWLLPAEAPLPKTTAEVGTPLLSCTLQNEAGEEMNSINIADISGSGIALQIVLDDDENNPHIVKDAQVLCLLIYNEAVHNSEHLVNFCCTGRITNIRQVTRPRPSKVIGIEFTNWAMLEPGNPTITWFPQAKATGIGPILQWVTKMDLEKRNMSRRLEDSPADQKK